MIDLHALRDGSVSGFPNQSVRVPVTGVRASDWRRITLT